MSDRFATSLVRPSRFSAASLACVIFASLALSLAANAQSLDDRLDERRYLEGLRELDLPEILEHFLTHYRVSEEEAEPTDIAEYRTAARDPSLTIAEREAAITRALSERESLIADHPNDPRLPTWLADQAADLYFDFLSLESSGWTSVLGVPSESQLRRSARAARDIDAIARRAEVAVEEAILSVELAPGFTENLNLQRERRRLTEQERDRRIPFFLGVGASLRAHVEELTESGRIELFTAAYETLVSVAPLLDRQLAAEARVHAGLAAARLGRMDDAQRLFDEADVEEAAPIVRFAARLSRASLRAADRERNLDRLAAYAEYARTMFYRLLIADRLFAHRNERDLRHATLAYADLLEAQFDVGRKATRSIVLARIADALREDDSHDRLPPFAVIAKSERNLLHDKATSDAVERLLEREDLTAIERTHALLTAARIHYRAGDHLAAAERYIAVARDHPEQPEAETAMEIGLVLASEQYRSSPHAARDVLHEGLTVVLRGYPRLPSIHRWRFAAGRLAMNESRYDDAVEHLTSIARGSEVWLDGRVLYIETLRRSAESTEDTDERARLLNRLTEAADAIEPELDAAVNTATGDRAQTLRRYRLHVRVHRAAVLAHGDRPQQALDRLHNIENDPTAHGPLIAEALQVRIAAYQAMERITEAHAEIDRFIEHSPERAAAVLGPMLASIQGRVEDLERRGLDDRAHRTARDELAPLARRLDEWINAAPDRFDSALGVRVADALRLSEEYERALRLYDRMLSDHPAAGPLLLGKAECLYFLGLAAPDESRLGEAMTIYRRLAQAGSELGDTYWLAQLRTLQILDATNRNTHQIAPQIQRLRLRDPELGGDRFRAGFDQLLSKHAG